MQADFAAQTRVGIGPVDDLIFQHVGVGDQRLGAVEGFHRRRAQVNVGDRAGHVADDDNIADAHLALKEQNDAADEVFDDRLRTKTDADRQRATDEGEHRQWNSR